LLIFYTTNGSTQILADEEKARQETKTKQTPS